MRRTYVRRRAAAGAVGALVLAAVVLLAGRALGASGGSPPAPTPAQHHVVRAGDTMWQLARARVGPQGDPRPLVAAIVEANGLDGSAIAPGMRLVIPPPP